MDAAQFIARLREAGELYRPEVVEPNDYMNARLSDFFEAVGDVYGRPLVERLATQQRGLFDGSRNAFQEIADGLLSNLIEAVDDQELRGRLRDPERFGLAVEQGASSRGFNSLSFQLGSAWLALVDYRLMQTLYVCARAMASRVNRSETESPCEVCEDSECPTPSLAISARRWFEAGLRGAAGTSRMPSEHWTPSGIQLAYTNAVAVDAERFVIAHELGHHVLGHTDAGQRRTVIPGGRGVEITAAHPSWPMEYAADLAGVTASLSVAVKATTDPGAGAAVQAVLGVEHFFSTLELLERVGGKTDDESHPPVAMRRFLVRAFLRSQDSLKLLESVSEDLAGMYRLLWETLATPSEHTMDGWAAEAAAIRAQIRPLMAKLSTGAPDGMDEVGDVFVELLAIRSSTSQLLFDRLMLDERNYGEARSAAGAFHHLYCDRGPTMPTSTREPFLGLGDLVDHHTTFGDSTPPIGLGTVDAT